MIQFINLKTTFETLGGSATTNKATLLDDIIVLSMSASIQYADGVLSRELDRERVTVDVRYGNDSSVYQSSNPVDIFDFVQAFNESKMPFRLPKATDITALMTHISGNIITTVPFEVSLVLCVVSEKYYKQIYTNNNE